MRLRLVLLLSLVFVLQDLDQCALWAEEARQWEPEIAAIEERYKDAPKGGIVFVGSSSIRMWETLQADFPGQGALNCGFGGSQIFDSALYAHRIVVPFAPRQVVMYAGGNDVNAGKEPETIVADFRRFVERVRDGLPNVPIAFISIAPNPARWLQVERVRATNGLIEEYCRSTGGLSFINVFSHMLENEAPKPTLFREDSLHMNSHGYQLWTQLVRPHLLPLLQ